MSYGGVTGNIVLTWGGTVMGEIPGDSFTTEASFEFCIIGVGTNDMASSSDIVVYPNPTTGLLNVTGINNNAKVAVYNITGSLVAEYNNFTDKTIDLSAQANGIYFVKISSDNFVATKRISLNR